MDDPRWSPATHDSWSYEYEDTYTTTESPSSPSSLSLSYCDSVGTEYGQQAPNVASPVTSALEVVPIEGLDHAASNGIVASNAQSAVRNLETVPQTSQPIPPQQWYGGGYYYAPYAGMPPPEHYMSYSPWMQPQMVGTPHQQPQGLPGPHQPGMPMSPRNPPPQLHPPGTPTMTSALPSAGHPPHPAPSPHTHTSSLSSMSSPPPTPSSTGPNRLNTYAPSFHPRTTMSKVKITSSDGKEVQLDSLKKGNIPIIPSAVPASPIRKTQVRLEKPEDKEKRLAEEQRERAKKEAGDKAKKEAEEKVKREAEEKAKKEKEEQERKKVEEQERVRKEIERQEQERRKQEEEEIARKEAEKVKDEERRRNEEERLKAEEEKVATTGESSSPATGSEPEEGELDESEEKKASEKEDAEEKFQDKGVLRINTALASPEATRKRHPGPLDLSSTRNQPIAQPLPSALATARIIEDFGSVSYPEGIKSPKVEVNVNAKRGQSIYDRDLLMQFEKDKPDNLPPLDAIGLEPSEQGAAVHQMSHGGSQRRSSAAVGPPSQGRPREGLGLGMSNLNGPAGNFNIGRFATSTKTSEEQFKESQMGRSASIAGGPPGVGTVPLPRRRPSPMVGPGALPLEYVAPLEHSASRWRPPSIIRHKQRQIYDSSPVIVDRKVRALLNKLTMERFDSISNQIISWANKSENEHDCRTLIQVIRLVFEKATDEAAWSEMYARLCRKMMEQISPKVQDEGIKNAEGKPAAGGQLFRKYLLNRCQEDFECGWAAKDESGKVVFSEEYYAAQKAKRRGLGLIKFIGELFKLQMLTERIVHECVKKLVGNVESPKEEDIESLCMLLKTVGELLDTAKARAHVDVYFSRMKKLMNNPNINYRMVFMLLDLIELRERKWKSRHAAAGPTTIPADHALAAKETAAKEKDCQRTLSMLRCGSRCGGDREQHPLGPDGWAVAENAPSRVPSKAGDLSNFGKIETNSMSFGLTGVFAKDKDKRESASLSYGSLNMFSKLMENPELAAEAAIATSSYPPSRKPSVDLGSAGASEPPQRKRRKLQLLPRSLPKPEETSRSTPAASDAGHSDDEESGAPTMSEVEAKARVGGDSEDFFSIRDLGEAELYFTELPSEHRWLFVDKLVTSAIESKEADAQLVGDFFSQAVSRNHCSQDHFEKGFAPTVEILDDIAIDTPKAFSLMAIMISGARLDRERCVRLASRIENSDMLLSLVSPNTATQRPRKTRAKEGRRYKSVSGFEQNSEDPLHDREAYAHGTQTGGLAREVLSTGNTSNAIPRVGPSPVLLKGTQHVITMDTSTREVLQLGHDHTEQAGPRNGVDLPSASALSAVPDGEKPDGRLSIIDEQVKIGLKVSVETFFAECDLEAGKKAFTECAPEHRWRLINKLVLSATMRGFKDARHVGELFSRTTQMGLCPGETFELGFAPVIDELDVLSLHTPAAATLVAMMLKGARIDSAPLEGLARRAVGDDRELLLGLLL